MRISGHWRLRKQRLRLYGSTCLLCGKLTFPPKMFCPQCGGKALRDSGSIYADLLEPVDVSIPVLHTGFTHAEGQWR